MEPMKIKNAKLASQVSIAGFSNALSYKQCDMRADMDRGILLIESREGKEFIVPFANVCLMEVLGDKEAAEQKAEAALQAQQRADALAKKEAARAAAAAAPAITGIVKYVKDANGQIVEK